jgi:PhzF family phenazine biosynthesis protein
MTRKSLQKFVVVDAFTDRPFAGNPAAVCVMDGPADEAWMKAVAREMNLSETAFLHPEGAPGPDRAITWRLRWLTPQVEVDLCGHATLASSHVLWQTGRLAPEAEARFVSRSGPLRARRQDGRIVLDFPSRAVAPSAPLPGLEQALGVPVRGLHRGGADLLIELDSAQTVRGLRPDQGALAALDVRGFIVTAAGDQPGVDFVSRFFGPRVGIPEDPVTGAAHTYLGPFWGARLGKQHLVGYQASARGGTVHIQLRGERVDLGGHAVTVSEGEILGPDLGSQPE